MKRSISLFIALALCWAGLLAGAAAQEAAANPPEPAYTPTAPPEPAALPAQESPSDSRASWPSLERINALAAGGQGDAADDSAARPREASNMTANVVKAAGVLAFVIAVILLLYASLRRLGAKNPLVSAAGGQILGRTYLAPKASLHYVRVGDRVLVVGVTPQQVNLVAEIDTAVLQLEAEPQPAPFAPRPKAAQSFPDMLTRMWNALPSVSLPAKTREEQPQLTPRQTPSPRQAPPGEETSGAPAQEDELASLQLELRRLQRRIEETRHAARR